MFPGISTGGGGFSGSSGAESSAGSTTLGGFNFAPNSGVPTWVLAAAAVVALVLVLRK